MAKLGDMPFAGRTSQFDSAAAFQLVASPTTAVVQILDAAQGEVSPNSDYVVVRFSGAAGPDSARSEGLELAQQCLDLMSVLGRGDLVTKNATEEFIVSWRTSGQQRVQVMSTTTLSFTVSSPTLVVRNRDGNEVPQEAPRPEYHPAFRYFRLSQTSDDLHEAFRNMYLAFELLLSSRHQLRRGERERDWLARALQATHNELDLGRFLRGAEESIVDELVAQVYTATRLPLFHAKMGRDVLTPQGSEEERRAVLRALDLLTKIVLELSRAWYQARRLGGGVFHGWVFQNLRSMYEGARILAMDDSTPFRADQKDLDDERYDRAVELHTEVRDDPDDERAPMLWGQVDVDSLWEGELRKIEVVGVTTPMLAHLLRSPLTLEEIDVFEYCDRTAIRNVRLPRRFFSR